MSNFFSSILANWKTTLAGVVAVIAAVLHANGVPVPDWTAPILAGVGLLFGRDANVTSEQSGAK